MLYRVDETGIDQPSGVKAAVVELDEGTSMKPSQIIRLSDYQIVRLSDCRNIARTVKRLRG